MLAHDRSGRGVPLVFLHAFPLDRRMWDVNRAAFDRHFTSIAPDLPGLGASRDVSTVGIDRMASAVWSLLDEIGVKETVVLIGLSMGGYVALQMIQQNPGRVRGLVMAATKAGADSPQAREGRMTNIELVKSKGLTPLADKMLPGLLGKSTHESNPALVSTVRGWIEGNSAPGVGAALQGMADRPDLTGFLGEINVPVLALAGAEDTLMPREETRKITESVRKGDFDIIPRAGHLLNLEQPDAFQHSFLNFLKRRVL